MRVSTNENPDGLRAIMIVGIMLKASLKEDEANGIPEGSASIATATYIRVIHRLCTFHRAAKDAYLKHPTCPKVMRDVIEGTTVY